MAHSHRSNRSSYCKLEKGKKETIDPEKSDVHPLLMFCLIDTRHVLVAFLDIPRMRWSISSDFNIVLPEFSRTNTGSGINPVSYLKNMLVWNETMTLARMVHQWQLGAACGSVPPVYLFDRTSSAQRGHHLHLADAHSTHTLLSNIPKPPMAPTVFSSCRKGVWLVSIAIVHSRVRVQYKLLQRLRVSKRNTRSTWRQRISHNTHPH